MADQDSSLSSDDQRKSWKRLPIFVFFRDARYVRDLNAMHFQICFSVCRRSSPFMSHDTYGPNNVIDPDLFSSWILLVGRY